MPMSDGNGFLRWATKHAGNVAVVAAILSLWAASGYPLRRRGGHSPLALDEYSALDAVGALSGLVIAVAVVREWLTLRSRLRHLDATQDFRFFLRAGAPRTIHALLLAVASHDGSVDTRERTIVERVLLRDLPDGVVPQDLKNWSVQPSRTLPLTAASQLARILTPAERMAVLRWCREVAAADGDPGAAETALLRDVARVLGGE